MGFSCNPINDIASALVELAEPPFGMACLA
jgi:hypothetical protein